MEDTSRTAIFIDAGYFDKVLDRNFGRPRIHYGKLADPLLDGKPLLRTYYYYCMPYQSNPPTFDETRRYQAKQSFIHNLGELPRFTLRQGHLARRVEGGEVIFQQKRVDIMLAVDLVRLSWQHQIQHAILIAGDSDFVPAVNDAQNSGVIVEVRFVPGTIHHELLQECDDRIPINDALIRSVLL